MSRTKLTLFTGAAVLLIAGCSSSQTSSTLPSTTAPAASAAAAATAAAPGALSGKWSGQYSGAYQGTFILHWRQSGSKLNGTIQLSAPAGSLPIHGTVTGSTIRFGTVGSQGIQYSGSVSGSSMSGTYKVQAPNGSVGGPWSATKAS